MKLETMQLKVLEFVKAKHGDQVRKYTGEPYWTHPYAVAEIIHKIFPGGIEIALCHDLIEDTDCNFPELHEKLIEIGYTPFGARHICVGVDQLTDKYTKENYPNLNRKERKEKECERLSKSFPGQQTIKYADLLHNSKSILEHDPGFAKIYLKEKKDILNAMRLGDIELFYKCCRTVFGMNSTDLISLATSNKAKCENYGFDWKSYYNGFLDGFATYFK